jgi:peptide/nickel transport system ATP-binding protein
MAEARPPGEIGESTLLAIDDLRVSFTAGKARVAAVNGVSITLQAGEALGIVGESGSGKSVTALSIMGLLRSARITGRIMFEGRDLLAVGPRELRRVRGGEIGFVFQDPMSSLNPIQGIGRQISEVTEAHLGLSRREGMKRAAELLELVGITGARSHLGDLPHQFSGGMRQRVMIAMAVSCNPKLLIADEPTTALDVTTQAQVLTLLRQLQRDLHMALIVITHDFGVVEEVAQRVDVMYAGTVVETGDLERVAKQPWHPYTQGLLRSVPTLDAERRHRLGFIRGSPPNPLALPPGCPFAARCDFVLDRCATEPPPERRVGRDISRCWLEPAAGKTDAAVGVAEAAADERAVTPVNDEEPLVVVDRLSVTYARRWGGFGFRRSGVVQAVDDISFVIRSGETLGLVGESGSGKSTTGRAMLRLVPIAGGSIKVEGKEVARMKPRALRVLARSVKIVFQDSIASLDPRMTVRELVEEPLRVHSRGRRAERRARVHEVLGLVGLGDYFLGRYPHELSGGQRQRVGVARAIVLSPKLIICDEPVSALDVSVQAQVVNLFHDLKDEFGLTYLFITHDLRVVRQLADRIAVMYRGRLLEVSQTDELFANPKHPYTQLLLASVPESSLRTNLRPVAAVEAAVDTGEQLRGCVFASRCPLVQDLCREERPPLTRDVRGVEVACHFAEQASLDARRPVAPLEGRSR